MSSARSKLAVSLAAGAILVAIAGLTWPATRAIADNEPLSETRCIPATHASCASCESTQYVYKCIAVVVEGFVFGECLSVPGPGCDFRHLGCGDQTISCSTGFPIPNDDTCDGLTALHCRSLGP